MPQPNENQNQEAFDMEALENEAKDLMSNDEASVEDDTATNQNNSVEDNSDENSDEDEGSQDENNSDGKSDKDKPKSFDDLLEQRNEARDKATETALLIEQQNKRIAELEDLVKNGSKAKAQEGEQNEDGEDEDKPLTKKEVEELWAKKENDKAKAELDKLNRTKSVTEFVSKNAEAKGYEQYIEKVMVKHPTLSTDMAFSLAKSICDKAGINVSQGEGNKTSKVTIGKPNSNTRKTGGKDVNKMTASEMKASYGKELEQEFWNS